MEQLTGQVRIYEAGSVLPTPFLTIPPASMRLETARDTLFLPIFPGLSEGQQQSVVEALKRSLLA